MGFARLEYWSGFIRDYYQQIYANKMDNVEEMDKYLEKYNLFSKWENWTATYRTIKLDYFITPYTKINLKWIIDVNIRL